MKKIVIGSLALASVVLLSSCEIPGQAKKMDAMVKDGDSMVKDTGAMMQKETMEKDAMMQKDDTMMEGDKMMKDDAMMKKDVMVAAGSYTTYSASAVTAALAAKKNVVLFFHATWCPSCKSADANFLQETAPANTVVFKVDYDTNKDLKVKYGVTSQHTFVSLNADGTLKKKASGLSHLSDLAELN